MTAIKTQASHSINDTNSMPHSAPQPHTATSKSALPIVLTTGEPAGIGMDILLQLTEQKALDRLQRDIIVLADETALKERAIQIYGAENISKLKNGWQRIATINEISAADNPADYLHQALAAHAHLNESDKLDDDSKTAYLQKPSFYLIDVPCSSPVVAGKLDVNNADMVIEQLSLAHALAYRGGAAAIVTGPLQKSILIEAGLTLDDGSMFTGHTEFFMQKSGCDKVVMMLANTVMKVALVTIHLPLREVADAVTPENVRQTVQIVLDDLNSKFGLIHPRVLVCGLNPHAGEDGYLGREEIEIINPVLREFQEEGHDISSTMPADTLFTSRHLKDCDAVIAMYHDQGLPVLKSHGFGDTVNLTLGLPYIRTSVDHGTALDLAGKTAGEGQASSSSLWQALKMADEMASAQARLL